MELGEARNTGVKNGRYAVAHGEINPRLERGVYLLVAQVHGTVQDNANLGRAFNDIAGQLAVLALIHAESGHGVRRVVGDAVALEHPGVHPHAVEFRFLNLHLGIRTDGVKVFFGERLAIQALFLQNKPIALPAGMLADKVGHKVKGFLLAVAGKALALFRVGESHGQGDMHMAVDDAGHDELAAQVRDLTFIGRKACLIAHIDEFSVFHYQSRGLGLVFVRRKDFGVLDDFVCFHGRCF